jgi:UDP-glucuronate 4-epimerase
MIIVTGGAGFIGSHLIEKLLSTGERVINIDNFNDYYDLEIKINNTIESTGGLVENVKSLLLTETTREDKLKKLKKTVDSENYTLEIADIRDMGEMERIFSENKIKYVINLAAMAGVRPSLEDPMLYMDVNIKGYMNLLECCKKFGVKKFVQASSSSVYGNNKKVPFKETDIVDFAISPYAATKKSGEVIGHTYHYLYNIDMIQLRFFTVYGPRQRPDLAIHKFTKMILEETPIPFYGDGSTERDYTYIEDIIDGISKSIKYVGENEGVYEIFNLGESQTISLNKMLETIENCLGKKAVINKMPMQPGDVLKTSADITKARNIIGYDPKTDFSAGVEKFIKWYRGNN